MNEKIITPSCADIYESTSFSISVTEKERRINNSLTVVGVIIEKPTNLFLEGKNADY
jgi:hypothetical protein